MQCKENIGGIEPRSIFFESTDLGQVEEQFTTRAIFENKEKFVFTLKGIVHFYNEWMSSIFLLINRIIVSKIVYNQVI